ncbi:Cy38.2 [Cynomolgus cytomegalovirus]|uniref:Cy38.2 n=1 Tax=Cynomolgus cytomegalovirus TaxID=1919083 RepID=UPI0009506764|nr:Cy38.2 [Cynomolgus cytomegalovirus]APT39252.1 Cy38.2 [Cynomolgus cytomegalovirus]APT39598.1 Cy38.2 [Cynomolgus cytomegalovirus]APT39771.1 Cy38.2 [Cynomolgus cytomegalovirus]WAQ80406.1 Cy38.2 [Cynomolgus cytomegalovirus]
MPGSELSRARSVLAIIAIIMLAICNFYSYGFPATHPDPPHERNPEDIDEPQME